jgi:hypothetical protein
MPSETAGSAEPVAPLVYKSADHVPQVVAGPEANAASAAPKAESEKKPNFSRRVGRFFKRVFGAE